MSFFGIKSGLQDFFRPFSAAILPTRTSITRLSPYKGTWLVWAEFDIIVSSKRLARDQVELQLGNVEREIMKEMCQYKPGQISGIDEIQYGGYERIYDSENWSKANWSSRTFIRCKFYHNVAS